MSFFIQLILLFHISFFSSFLCLSICKKKKKKNRKLLFNYRLKKKQNNNSIYTDQKKNKKTAVKLFKSKAI